ncbi:MAG: LD-carboxypeptidase, partial [Bacteroidota bacterium]|nr:LD-carboxypeptidase [Bacteroidota bacterium]
MNRKNFLSSVLAVGGVHLTSGSGRPDARQTLVQGKSVPDLIIPPYLQPGDTIGITCPAGAISNKEIQPSVDLIGTWGFHVRIGETVGKKDFTFGGTDEERMKDLQQMMDDPSLKAILCARGGYGSVHIIDRLDLRGMHAHPKWLIGFSDITVVLCHLHRHLNMASIHSKMCNSFPDDWAKAEPIQIDTILSIRQALSGEKVFYPVTPSEKNKPGQA